MIDFIDKTAEKAGTPINRANLMAIQGFVASTVSVRENGIITQENSKGEILTIAPWTIDGTRQIMFKGEKTITMIIQLTPDGYEVKLQ